MLAAETRISRPTMSQLEAIGRHAAMLRRRTATLPPHVSSLYALTRLPFTRFAKAIEMDLRGMSRSEIARRFAPAPPKGSQPRLMTIRVPPGLAEERRLALTAEIRAAVVRIGATRGVDLVISPRTAASRRQPIRMPLE